MTKSNNQPENHDDQVCLRSFKTHWAEAQIDGPMQMVSRFDDLSKLLITIGGFVLGALATMLREPNFTKSAPIIVVLSLVFLFFLFAVLVCYFQPAMRAKEILKTRDDASLEKFIDEWCEDLVKVVKKKRALLTLSVAFFASSIFTMMLLLMFS